MCCSCVLACLEMNCKAGPGAVAAANCRTLPSPTMTQQVKSTNRLLRPLLVAAGTLCVGLGVLGIFLPLLPTTPFLLLAAACYARSSPRLLRWLEENRWFGAYIRNWREGRGILLRDKLLAIGAIWLTIGLTVIYFVPIVWVKILLMAIALAVSIHLLWLPTYRPEREI